MSTLEGPRLPPPHPLRDYALLADGERGVLVGPRGEIAWMCFPRWHDDAVFCSLVGGRSAYSVSPAGRFVGGGYYEPGGLIWRSRWITESGAVESREALAMPADPRRAVLLRRVVAVRGQARLEVLLQPAAGFDRRQMSRLRRDEKGAWTAGLGEGLSLRWTGGEDASAADLAQGRKALRLELRLEEGECHDFVLELGVAGLDGRCEAVDRLWDATEREWRQRVPELEQTIAPRDARHAYAVMSGLTAASGGMVAAATTSLPERAEQGRNYDYRYVWIRDQAYAGQGVAAAGPHPLLDDAVGFVGERLLEDGPGLMPAYTVEGEPVPSERELELPGYPGARDVAGNRVSGQFQLDCFGEALMLFAAAARHDRLDADGWRAAELAVEAIESRWQEPDAGIWELEPGEWTHSRLAAAAGLRAIAAHAPGRRRPPRWRELADLLVAEAGSRSLHPSGRWQRRPDDPGVDAALLLAAIRGAVAADDPRSLATLRAVAEDLTEDGYCYRFQHPGELPLGEAEGAFLLCGFWMALAYAQQGDDTAAADWFQRNRGAAGSPGLLAEEFDVRQRQLRGNLPQAFVHALLLECAATLYRNRSLGVRRPSPGFPARSAG